MVRATDPRCSLKSYFTPIGKYWAMIFHPRPVQMKLIDATRYSPSVCWSVEKIASWISFGPIQKRLSGHVNLKEAVAG